MWFPVALTTLVGREREIEQVCALLSRADVRLLTLTGPGGVGKTRLALAAAESAAADFADGVLFVPLSAVSDTRLVPSAIGHALGIDIPDALPFGEMMRVVVGNARKLLVVDNFEHLLSAGPVLTELLASCPRVTLLVTSRERLRLSGERDLPVQPLDCPTPEDFADPRRLVEFPAVRLFVERAEAAEPAFALSEENAAAVAAVCQRLDGLPLALELAAVRVPHLSPAALLIRLARRLPLLTQGPRDAPARLQTMRDAIAWSHDHLTPDERTLFRRLAVFSGGFTVEGAEAVAGQADAFDCLASLIDKSLVRRISTLSETRTSTGGKVAPRFAMLETIREFALEQLVASGEELSVRSTHARFFCELAEAAQLVGPDEASELDRLESEHANMRETLTWALDAGDREVALRLAAKLGQFWLRRGHLTEGRSWLERALALAPELEPKLRAGTLNALGELHKDAGAFDDALRCFQVAEQLARSVADKVGEATALHGRSTLADHTRDFQTMLALSEMSANIWRELGDDLGLATSAHTRAWAYAGLGRITEADAQFHEALRYARAAGAQRWIAHILNSLGNLRGEQGEFSAARPFLMEALASARTAGDRAEVAETLADLGWLCLELDETAAAAVHFRDSLSLLAGSGRIYQTVYALEGCAVLAHRTGQRERSRAILAATMSMRNEIGISVERDLRLNTPKPGRARGSFLRMASAITLDGTAGSMEAAFLQAEAVVSTPRFLEPAQGGSDPAREKAPENRLSAREREVLRLVADGRSDQAIGEALFISSRTASKHVGAILAKLGVTTRAEAAARAVRDGLV